MFKLILLLFIVLASNCFIYIQSYHNLNIIGYNRINKQYLKLNAGKPVNVSFEPSGKSIITEQNELIADVAKKAGVIIPFGCKQGRCNSCEVRLNGRGYIYIYYILINIYTYCYIYSYIYILTCIMNIINIYTL